MSAGVSGVGTAMRNEYQADRWIDFRRRVDCDPSAVYRHRTRGWEYIPIHAFADEPEVLAELGLRVEDCRFVDAWWGIDGDATLLESGIVGAMPGPARLLAKATEHEYRWIYLEAVFDASFVTRTAFEAAMERFADAGFPHGSLFQLTLGDPSVQLPKEFDMGDPA